MKSKYFVMYILEVVAVFGFFFFLGAKIHLFPDYLTPQTVIILFVLLSSSILTLQSVFTLVWMLYAWEDPNEAERQRSPKVLFRPLYSFSALIPARHEEKVIADTIKAVNKIKYPDILKEILVLCKKDDIKTISKAKEVIKKLGQKNIRLIVFDSSPVNKPHGLNYGLIKAKNEIITIFDAEDEPHPDIYKVVNTVLIKDGVDVVQSGVQLMNYRAHWFSALNVMEYFLWFKSGLHFFLKVGGITPLGGNTVFFKKRLLKKIRGWDENCLTEDAEIGIRLTLAGAKTRVVYDERHATQEETPTSISGFIRQRTRWNQGFMQIFMKGDWKKLPKFRQKMIILYILLSPLIQTLFWLYTPAALWIAIAWKLPILVSIYSFIPFYLLILHILVYITGLYEFTKIYKLKYPYWMPLKVLLTFYPYQFALVFSSLRALYRVALGSNNWEKTLHLNNHRNTVKISFAAT